MMSQVYTVQCCTCSCIVLRSGTKAYGHTSKNGHRPASTNRTAGLYCITGTCRTSPALRHLTFFFCRAVVGSPLTTGTRSAVPPLPQCRWVSRRIVTFYFLVLPKSQALTFATHATGTLLDTSTRPRLLFLVLPFPHIPFFPSSF